MTQPRLSILVVDDERAVREVVGDLLRELGHGVELAADGEEALRKSLDEQDFQLVSLMCACPGWTACNCWTR